MIRTSLIVHAHKLGRFSSRKIAWLAFLAAVVSPVQALADDQMEHEWIDVADAIGNLDQSYGYNGLRSGSGSAYVAGSGFRDRRDSAPRRSRNQPSASDLLDQLQHDRR